MFLVPLSKQASDLSRSFDRLFDDDLFGRFFAPAARPEGGARSPALDVAESDQAYTVKLDLPGVGKDDVKVTVDGRRVTVEASVSKHEEKKEGDRVVYSERSVSSYARSFTLPQDVQDAETTAKLDNGVLTLTLPKRGSPSVKRIAVG